VTLLEHIQLHLDLRGDQGAALAVVLKRCAQWTLGPCVAGDSCNHCVAELLLRDIATAIGVYP